MALTIAPALKTLWTLGKHGADVYKKLAAVDEDLFYVSRAIEALRQPLALALRFRRRYATMAHVDAAVEMTSFTLEKCVKLLDDRPDPEDEQALGTWLKNKVNNLSRQQHLQSLVPKLQLCQQSLLLALSSLQLQCARAELAERAPFVFVEPAVDRAVAIAQSFRLGQSAREVVAAGQVYVWTESKTGGPPVWEDLKQNSVVLVPPKTQQTMAASSGSPAQDAEEKEKAIKRLSVDPTDEQAKKVLRDEAQAVAGGSDASRPWELWLEKESAEKDDDTRIIVITSETVLKRRLSTACKPTSRTWTEIVVILTALLAGSDASCSTLIGSRSAQLVRRVSKNHG